jgi:DNA-binding MarR family transcriptional regulator
VVKAAAFPIEGFMDTKSEVSGLTSLDPVPPVPEPDAHLGRWLWYVYSHLSLSLARKLEAHNVTVAEWLVLSELSEAGEISAARLARRLSMPRNTISRHGKRLSAKGLVKRRLNPRDERAQTLTLTSTGQRVVPALTALASQNDTDIFGRLPPEEQNAMRRMLRHTVEHCAVDPYREDLNSPIEFTVG